MNHAHTSHYTDSPDPRIEYVLRGWDPDGGKAVHHLRVDDVLIRNVTTDIRGFGATRSASRTATRSSSSRWRGSASAISAICTTCSTTEDLAFIGQLDVVMVPVDGAYTMDQSAMVETLQVREGAARCCRCTISARRR